MKISTFYERFNVDSSTMYSLQDLKELVLKAEAAGVTEFEFNTEWDSHYGEFTFVSEREETSEEITIREAKEKSDREASNRRNKEIIENNERHLLAQLKAKYEK